MDNFTQALRDAMTRLSVSQAELARRSGTTKETVGLILHGKNSARGTTRRAMAQAVGYETDQALVDAFMGKKTTYKSPLVQIGDEQSVHSAGSIASSIAAETGIDELKVSLVLSALAKRIG